MVRPQVVRQRQEEAAHDVTGGRPRVDAVVAERVAARVREADLDMPVPERRGIAGVSHDGDRLAGRHALTGPDERLGHVAVVDVLSGERAARGFDDRVVGAEARRVSGHRADQARSHRVHQGSVGGQLEVHAVVGAAERAHVGAVERQRVGRLRTAGR